MQHYVIKFVNDLRQVDGFLRVLLSPPPIRLTAMHNIAENGAKHHSPNPPSYSSVLVPVCCSRVHQLVHSDE